MNFNDTITTLGKLQCGQILFTMNGQTKRPVIVAEQAIPGLGPLPCMIIKHQCENISYPVCLDQLLAQAKHCASFDGPLLVEPGNVVAMRSVAAQAQVPPNNDPKAS
jgi:hypothetical protein